MDITTYIQQQLAGARRQVDVVMQDLTDEQFNWLPPGTLSPISATFIHIVAGEDYQIQVVAQGRPRLWEAQAWGEKVGVPNPPNPNGGWDVYKTVQLAVAPVLAYQQAVRAATDAYLAGLTMEELGREVNYARRAMPVANLLMMLVVHSASHAGEIAAIKGMQGVKGLPF